MLNDLPTDAELAMIAQVEHHMALEGKPTAIGKLLRAYKAQSIRLAALEGAVGERDDLNEISLEFVVKGSAALQTRDQWRPLNWDYMKEGVIVRFRNGVTAPVIEYYEDVMDYKVETPINLNSSRFDDRGRFCEGDNDFNIIAMLLPPTKADENGE